MYEIVKDFPTEGLQPKTTVINFLFNIIDLKLSSIVQGIIEKHPEYKARAIESILTIKQNLFQYLVKKIII